MRRLSLGVKKGVLPDTTAARTGQNQSVTLADEDRTDA
jgi:hypothetical protein